MIPLTETITALLQRELCDRCLGRQVARLGTGTTNEERGRAMKLYYAMLTEAGEIDGIESRFLHEITRENDSSASTDPYEEISTTIPIKDDDPDPENIQTNPDVGGINVAATNDPSDARGEGHACSLCGGLLEEIDDFVELVVEALEDYEYNSFLIGTVVDKDILQAEKDLMEEFRLSGVTESIKNELNREIGIRVEKIIQKVVCFEKPDIAALVDTRFDSVSLQVAPIFIYGRYRKFDRSLPQTVWNCKRCWGKGCEYCHNTGKIYPTSVQELIGDPFLEESGGSRHLFHGMGREDIDARMLGNGRPFVLEISVPRIRSLDIEKIQEMVNTSAEGRVEIDSLRYVERKYVILVKNAKVDKSYEAVVEFDEVIKPEKFHEIPSLFNGKIISQRTPTRVAHRRGDLVRERKVININCELLDELHATFAITGESGLYIKELIHGDDGRTEPSISGFLGTGCTVTSLDVISVHYDEDQ